jgi:hypothetical protein
VETLEQAVPFGCAAVEFGLISRSQIFGIFRNLTPGLSDALFGFCDCSCGFGNILPRFFRRGFVVVGSEARSYRVKLGFSIGGGLFFFGEDIAIGRGSRLQQIFVGPNFDLMSRVGGRSCCGRRRRGLLLCRNFRLLRRTLRQRHCRRKDGGPGDCAQLSLKHACLYHHWEISRNDNVLNVMEGVAFATMQLSYCRLGLPVVDCHWRVGEPGAPMGRPVTGLIVCARSNEP